MNTLRIIFQDSVLRNIPLKLNGCTFFVTLSTKKRNLHRCNCWIVIIYRKNIMFTMAILAEGCKFISFSACFSMQTFRIKSSFFVVAWAAIYQSIFCSMRHFIRIDFRMTINTFQAWMNRFIKNGSVKIKRNKPAINFLFKIRIVMTHEAVFIRLCMSINQNYKNY